MIDNEKLPTLNDSLKTKSYIKTDSIYQRPKIKKPSIVIGGIYFVAVCSFIYFIWIKFATFAFIRDGNFFTWFFNEEKEILFALGIFNIGTAICLIVVLKKKFFKTPGFIIKLIDFNKGLLGFFIAVIAWSGIIFIWLDSSRKLPPSADSAECFGELCGILLNIYLWFLLAAFPSFVGLILGIISWYENRIKKTKSKFLSTIGCILTSIFFFMSLIFLIL